MDDPKREPAPPDPGGAASGAVGEVETVDDDEWGQAPPPASAPAGGAEAAPSGARGGRAAAAIAVFVLGGLALVAYWWFGREEAPSEPEAAAIVEPEPAPAPVEEPLELPPLDASDEFLRALLAALTEHPDVLGWLLGDELARNIAIAVDNVADGDSPRRALRGLAPAGDFAAAGEGEERRVDPASFRRYDSVAAAIAGADAPALARVIEDVMPLMEAAYAELGRPDRTFAVALLAALDRLVAVPVPETPILLEERTLRFEYRDPRLERLDEASKHLLRLGPDNQRKVQNTLGSLAEELHGSAPPS